MIEKLKSWVKFFYQKPFSRELEGVLQLLLYKSLMFVVSAVYAVRYRVALRLTKNYFDSKKAEIASQRKSAFVFANGPSLADIDLLKVGEMCGGSGFDLIAINSFLSKSENQILPTFAVFADNVHFSSPEGSQYRRDIEVCVRNRIRAFVPAKYFGRGVEGQLAYNGLCSIYSTNTSNVLVPAGYYGVTAFFALSLAKQLGYEKIYICGFDNSYFKDFEVTGDGRMIIRHRHYYDEQLDDVEVPCLYGDTSMFFFDIYRHFYYLRKIVGSGGNIFNVAKSTYLSFVPRDLNLDIYK